jgi:hypothetical protein
MKRKTAQSVINQKRKMKIGFVASLNICREER